MRITYDDLWWLRLHYPELSTKLSTAGVMGTLEISACYDSETRRLFTSRHATARSHDTFISDHFSIEINFDVADVSGWPKVYEIGMRHRSIARRQRIRVEDLHFYPTGEACFGFRYPWDPSLTLEYFLAEIVEPFFYRLAYVDLYGLPAAQTDLWLEHSHGIKGYVEYLEDVRRGARGISII